MTTLATCTSYQLLRLAHSLHLSRLIVKLAIDTYLAHFISQTLLNAYVY